MSVKNQTNDILKHKLPQERIIIRSGICLYEWYDGPMKTRILDASKIDPQQDPSEFFCSFYELEPMNLAQIRKHFYMSSEPMVTEVFNWPVRTPNWKDICLTLESIQQHSPSFYVIWGPETENAVVFEKEKQESEILRAEDNHKSDAPKDSIPDPEPSKAEEN